MFHKHRQRTLERAQAMALETFDQSGAPCPVCGQRMIPIAYGRLPRAPEGWTGPIMKAGCVVGPENWWCERCRQGRTADPPVPPLVVRSHPSASEDGRLKVRVTGVTFGGRTLPYTRATLTIRPDPAGPTRWKVELSGTDGNLLSGAAGRDLPLLVALSDGRAFSRAAHVARVTGNEAVMLGSDSTVPSQ